LAADFHCGQAAGPSDGAVAGRPVILPVVPVLDWIPAPDSWDGSQDHLIAALFVA
jgi:hypothetical protein